MARTLIGELLLKVRADTKEAKSVNDALERIERNAKRLGDAPWGIGMQRQLDKLKATPRELDLIQQSWDRLIRDIKTNNLDAAMRKNRIASWRQATINDLTAVRSHMNRTHEATKKLSRSLDNLKKFGFLAAGGYRHQAEIQQGAGFLFRQGQRKARQR